MIVLLLATLYKINANNILKLIMITNNDFVYLENNSFSIAPNLIITRCQIWRIILRFDKSSLI